MEIIRNIEHLGYKKNRIITVGTFDGVHLGHREIFRVMKQKAEEKNLEVTVISFEPHPRIFLYPWSDVKLLTSFEEKTEILKNLGIDVFLVPEFNEELSQMSSEYFLSEYLMKRIGFCEIAVGYDHRFGKGRDGDEETVRKFARQFSVQMDKIEAVAIDDEKIGSSAIRQMMEAGNIKKAAKFLGRFYSFTGKVVSGLQRGRKIGFPTANIELSNPVKQMPKNGVYAVFMEIDGVLCQGVMNIGIRPTFDNKNEVFREVHLFDFSQDIYGKKVTVFLAEIIRNEQKFNGIEALAAQIKNDVETAQFILRKIENPLVYLQVN